MKKFTKIENYSHPEFISGSNESETMKRVQGDMLGLSAPQICPQDSNELINLSNSTNFKRKIAFTLAEVLITLGIIGVVAALTIPTLMKDFQKRQWVTGLKAALSMYQNAVKQMMYEEGVEDFTQTEYFKECRPGYTANISDRCSAVVGRYFKVNKVLTTRDLPGCTNNDYPKGYYTDDTKTSCSIVQPPYAMPIFVLANGMLLQGTNVDVNGLQGPNVMGRDVFNLKIYKAGVVDGNGARIGRNEDTSTVEYIDTERHEEAMREAISEFTMSQQLAVSLCKFRPTMPICDALNNVELLPITQEDVNKYYSDQCLYGGRDGRVYCSFHIMQNGWTMDY